MNFFIIPLFISLIISLFCIYLISRDDFIFLRKDVTLEKIFNLVFLTFFSGLFFSRLIFVIIESPKMFLNPLAFFLFPYFPGLSLIGGVLGALVFLVYYTDIKQLPFEKILDVFSVGFLASLSFGYLGFFLLSGIKDVAALALVFIYIILFFVFIKYAYQLLSKGKFKDGSIGYLILFMFSFISIITAIVTKFSEFAFIRNIENYLFLLLLIISIYMFAKNEKLIKYKRR